MASPMSHLPRDVAGLGPVADDVDEADILSELTPQTDDDASDASGMQVEEQPDGSAIVMLEGEDDEDVETEFDDNLAEVFDDAYLSRLGSDLVEAVESDQRVRADRDKQYAEGIKRTGLGNDAPGGADFEGASRTVHPMLSKGCVDFGSRAIKELYPASGPCKTQIVGEATDQKVDRADRKKRYMNWQLTTQVPENRNEFERLLSQLPLGGSQYKRWWNDPELKRPRTETVYIDDVFFPYHEEFWTTNRLTHRQYISKEAYQARIESGLYRDLDLVSPPASMENQSQAQAASDRVEGAEEDMQAYSKDGLREIYQIEANLPCDDDSFTKGKTSPYIVHVDVWSKKVLGMFRNWPQKDQLRRKKHWMVEYTFIPWRGGPGVGLAHLIGSLAASGTGAVRAILDAAHIQNFPGGLKLKGGRNSGQSVTVGPGELQELEAPPNVDDIRKLVMPFPFNGPSTVLYQLLEWITQQAEGVVTTASERIADGGGANMPVGTAMALIESDSANFSAIHARLHSSLKQELLILHRLNAENLTDEEVVEELGELVVSRADFEGPVDIIPVSDPHIFSEAQRFAQLQAVMQLSSDERFAQYFKADRLLSRSLKLLQLPDVDDIANLPKDPQRLAPLEENYTASIEESRPLKVYDEQDDFIHLQAHIHFMTSPMFGSSPLIGPKALPALISHCKEHLLALYRKHAKAATDAILAVAEAQGIQITPEEAEGRGVAFADGVLAQTLGPMVMPGLTTAMQAAMQMAPKPPDDPLTAAARIKDAGDTQRKQMEIASEEKRTQADLEANDRAAQLAAQAEGMQQMVAKHLGELNAQLQLIRDDRNNDAKAFVVQLQGENAQAELRLKAFLEAQLATLPDLSQQVAGLDQRTGQISTDVGSRIGQLEHQRQQDAQTIMGLLHEIKTISSQPWWQRRSNPGATEGI